MANDKKLRPMKASEAEEARMKFPGWASPKYDGIRCWAMHDGAYSNTMKLIPNQYIQSLFRIYAGVLQGLDGELVVGAENHPNVMQATTSGCMSRDGEPSFTYLVYDAWSLPTMEFDDRRRAIAEFMQDFPEFVKVVPHKFITSQEELDAFEAECVAAGYEGAMYRHHNGVYKYGRSTARECYLVKIKRFSHDEATIVGFEELMHNENELGQDEMGYAKRSSSQDGLVPSGMLGAYWVENLDKWPKPFKISAGSMSHEERKAAWERRESDKGRIARFKYFKHGVKDVPRHGLFDAYRHPDDIAEY